MLRGLFPGELGSDSDSSDESLSDIQKSDSLLKKVLHNREAIESLDIVETNIHQEDLSEQVESTPKNINTISPTERLDADKRGLPEVESRIKAEDQGINKLVNLEGQIDKSLKDGDITRAEELNDELIRFESQHTNSCALKAREFLKKNKEADDRKISRKRKKLAWTFEAKKKWETKSNM